MTGVQTWLFRSVSGAVPTPHGEISVAWRQDRGNGQLVLRLTSPLETRGTLGLRKPERKPFDIRVNGATVRDTEGHYHPVSAMTRGSEGTRYVYLHEFLAGTYVVELTEH